MTPGEEFEQWWNEKYTGFSPKTNTTRVIKIMVQQGYLQGREDERRKAEAENKGLRIMISDYQKSCKRWEEVSLDLARKLDKAEARVKELKAELGSFNYWVR